MHQHIKTLGILYIAFSCLGLLGAIIVFTPVTGAGILSGDMEAMAITSIIASAVSVFLLVISLPGVIGGYGLLKKYSWARILVLILGALNLLNIPFGTILGAYTFWVLLNDDATKEFA